MPSAVPPRLDSRLCDALSDHDLERRHARRGVASSPLDIDHALWLGLGTAIADLAHLIVMTCQASHFGDLRPEAPILAARLSEAIDDQIDMPAWRIVDAEARLRAAAL
jgi:hypothetical protein